MKKIEITKRIGLLLLSIALVAGLSACAANSAEPPLATPSPTLMPNVSPGTEGITPMPGATDGAMMTAAMTGPESSALSKKANDAAVKISEIGTCVTAIIGDSCVVGVTFDPQYKGELTDRIRDMVATRIQSLAPSIERVAVTSDPEIAAQIGNIAERISKTDALAELAGELDAVMGKIR